MGNCSTALRISEAARSSLDDIEVIEDVVKTAVIGESIEEIANRLFDLHDIPRVRHQERTASIPPP